MRNAATKKKVISENDTAHASYGVTSDLPS